MQQIDIYGRKQNLPSDSEFDFWLILSRICFDILNSPNELISWPGEIEASVDEMYVDDCDSVTSD